MAITYDVFMDGRIYIVFNSATIRKLRRLTIIFLKIASLAIGFLWLVSCNTRQGKADTSSRDSSLMRVEDQKISMPKPEYDWQKGFALTHNPSFDSVWGKPIKFYIDNPNCSNLAIAFYQGNLRPTDDDTTGSLLLLVITDDSVLRPFYRWCLDKTIQIQDGALAEYTGIPARRYTETFPIEFFEYMDSDTTEERYSNWVGAIGYSGFYEMDVYNKTGNIRKDMISAMRKKCNHCSIQLIERFTKLTHDCFP